MRAIDLQMEEDKDQLWVKDKKTGDPRRTTRKVSLHRFSYTIF